MAPNVKLSQQVLTDIADHFLEFDDDPDSLFGEYPRVYAVDNTIQILHETEQKGVYIIVHEIEFGEA